MSLLGPGGDYVESTAIRECKRDYDGELQRLNKRIEDINILHERLIFVVESDLFYSISDNKSRKELAALIGGASVESRRLFHNWETLVKEIEKEEEK